MMASRAIVSRKRIDAVVAGLDAFAARHAGLGPLLGLRGAFAEAENVEHAGDHGFGIGVAQSGRPRDRAGGEAGAAFGAGVEHVVDAAIESFFESGVLHALRIAQNAPIDEDICSHPSRRVGFAHAPQDEAETSFEPRPEEARSAVSKDGCRLRTITSESR